MALDLASYVRDVPDFPAPGIVFKDITPLLADRDAFAAAVDAMATTAGQPVDVVAGIESRGFLFGVALAAHFGVGFVPIRKAGKLPAETVAVTYDLEYGTDTLEIHGDAVDPGQRVLVVDDVLATGGTAAAATELVEKVGGEVAALSVLIELSFLGGRHRLERHLVHACLAYDGS